MMKEIIHLWLFFIKRLFIKGDNTEVRNLARFRFKMVESDKESRKRQVRQGNNQAMHSGNDLSFSKMNSHGTAHNMASNQSPHAYKNAREYAQAVRQWLWQYHCWSSMNNFMAMMPLYAMNYQAQGAMGASGQYMPFPGQGNIHQRATPQTQIPTGSRGAGARTRHHGREYVLPSFWKRVAAELIDFTLLFYIKLVVSVIVMRELGYMDGTLDYNLFFDFDEMDYDKAFAITSEVIAVEIVNRLLITGFETLCLRRGIGVTGGSTPGKRLMGLRVVSCSDIVDLGNNRILVYPAQNIGWANAFVRSVIKNFTIAFFFPACLTVFMFKYSRAAYDILSSTIVVQCLEGEELI